MKLKDNNGNELDKDTVGALAVENVLRSMSKLELARFYVDEMPEVALVQWATDEEGNFPENSGAK